MRPAHEPWEVASLACSAHAQVLNYELRFQGILITMEYVFDYVISMAQWVRSTTTVHTKSDTK